MENKKQDVVGLIPAAGFANRISPLPCSKEIYPIGFEYNEKYQIQRPKVVSANLLKQFKHSGTYKVFMIIRKGKWDIPEYYGTGSEFDINLSYIVTEPTQSMPHTINKAYAFIKNEQVLFGLPDIYLDSTNPFASLLQEQKKTDTDVTIGLYKARNPEKVDMVKINSNGLADKIVIKPHKTDLIYTWLCATWNPKFTQYIRNYLKANNSSKSDSDLLKRSKNKELYLGDIIQAAILDGFKVSSVIFENDSYIDIGTFSDLRESIKLNL
jgi:glucose-1-phosphate thymidylyltransferase